jgi:hypothetical protein
MGYGTWDHGTRASYLHTENARTLRNHTAYTADINEGRATRQVHPQMNPHGVIRESRDSAAHPESLAIGVMFDVTGSMGAIPRELQRRLVNLMTLLAERRYVDHPQVLFGAIGDATCDAGPLQVGQFETALEIDQDLERVWAEGRGGGQHTESYELAHYFFAHKVVADCWERRRTKGYLFTMGDEMPYPLISRRHVRELLGDTLQADVPHADVMREVQEKWNVFHLLVETGTSRSDPAIRQAWTSLLPEGHVISLKDPKNISEIIGLIVGLSEGRITPDDIERDLTQLGSDADSIREVMEALAPLAAVTRGIRL